MFQSLDNVPLLRPPLTPRGLTYLLSHSRGSGRPRGRGSGEVLGTWLQGALLSARAGSSLGKKAGHLDPPGGSQPPSRPPTSLSWGLTHWLVCGATESHAWRAEERPVPPPAARPGHRCGRLCGWGQGEEAAKGRSGDPVALPGRAHQSALPSGCVRRARGNPRRGTMTGRETETGSGRPGGRG